ncbi:MAG: acetate kinase [Lachnospiraceae bacterium]|nr:acetate kinase [Lachnospiraceae bacterium]
MNVLVINCGSSSLKYQVIDSETEQVKAKGLCERIGIDGNFSYQPAGGEKEEEAKPMPTHNEAVSYVIEALTNDKTGIFKSLDEIDCVGHRIVHGGTKLTHSFIINDDIVNEIENCSDLAPLHNPAHILGIKACEKLMPNVPMAVVFDTAFQQTMPAKAYLYAIPYKYYEEDKVRKYGFHGTSHMFVSQRAIELMGNPEHSKVIVCHLGNGASVSCEVDGKCMENSMGLTPLDGLVMGTRCGDIDPSVVEYINKKHGNSVEEILNIFNKESGVYAISDGMSDFRDIANEAEKGNERAQLALDMFAYRVAKYIGSYVAAMNGVDTICFTAGIGENNGMIRGMICDYLTFLGLKLDDEANKVIGEEKLVSSADSKVKVYVIPTNEELAIARETVALLK